MSNLKPTFLRTPYNYDMALASDETGLKCEDPSLAQQNAKDECDINVIMDRFGRGMDLPENFRPPQYDDFTQIGDYHAAMNAVAQANEAFDAMPAKLRARFNNDPVQLMSFLDDDSNRSEAQKLGLLVPPPPPAPENATTAPPDPAKPSS
jgi:phage internal scaffolding protein